nr:cold shock domain-containing protein [uncultured Roseateles sp.]
MMRFEGTLKDWNYDRGFGAIAPRQGGQELFVHASAFPAGSEPPQIGEALSFEVTVDQKGRKQVQRVQRSDGPPAPPALGDFLAPAASRERQRALNQGSGRRWSFWLLVAGVVTLSAAGAGLWVAGIKSGGSTSYAQAAKVIKVSKVR